MIHLSAPGHPRTHVACLRPRTARLAVLFVALLGLGLVPTAYAQLELDADGHVGIGRTPNAQWTLGVQDDTSVPVFGVYTGSTITGPAIKGQAHGTPGVGIGGEFYGGHMGLRVYATTANTATGSHAQGMYTKASGSETNTGVYAHAHGGNNASSFYAYAAQGTSQSRGFYANAHGSPNENYAVKTSAYAAGAAKAYGVYGYAYSADAGGEAYGVYARTAGSGTRYAGFFEGDVEVTGTLTWGSDRKFKEAVEDLAGSSVLERIMQLKPKKYRYKQDKRGKKMGFSEKERFGFIAQELEAVFPELVSEKTHTLPAVEAEPEPWDGEGTPPEPVILEPAEQVSYKALNYVDLVPLLVQAVQEQQAEIAALEAALEQLGVKLK